MKKAIVLFSLALTSALFLSGCVAVTYTKETVVRKDGDGKIIEVVVTERITEPHSESARIKKVDTVELNHLK